MDVLEKLAECPICKGYSTNATKLKCQHMFCYPCIEDHIQKYFGQPSFPCPVCQHRIPAIGDTVDIANVSQLPEDVFTNKLRNYIRNIKRNGKSEILEVKCPSHPENSGDFFCMGCYVPACMVCKSNGHKSASCQLLNISENEEVFQQKIHQISEDIQNAYEFFTSEFAKIMATFGEKRHTASSSYAQTAASVKNYYLELQETVTKYLKTQEQKVLSTLEEVVEKENAYTDRCKSLTASHLSSLQLRKDLSNILSKQNENLLPADRLNLGIHLLSNLSDFDSVVQSLTADSKMNLIMRFMIDTELEDLMQEGDLVKIEILSSCHTAPVPAVFESHRLSSSDEPDSPLQQQASGIQTPNNQTSLAGMESTIDNGRQNITRNRQPPADMSASQTRRRHSGRSLSAGDTGRRSQNRNRSGPSNHRRSKSPQSPRPVTPPPSYLDAVGGTTAMIDRQQRRPLPENRRLVPSAPPLQTLNIGPGQSRSLLPPSNTYRPPRPMAMTIPKAGVLIPKEHTKIQNQTALINQVSLKSILESRVTGDSRSPRIVGVASLGPKFILADKWNNCLKLIAKDHSKIDQVLKCDAFQLWDIASLSNIRCVVVAPKEKLIVFAGFSRHTSSRLQFLGKLNVSSHYACVSYFERDDHLVCGICPPYGTPSIDILTTSGFVLKSFKDDSFGKPLFTYPRNISVTEEGTMAVCDLDSHSVVFVNIDNGMYKTFSGNEEIPLQDPQCVTVLESHRITLLLNSKFRKLIATSYSGELLQQLDNVPLYNDAKRMMVYGNELLFAHHDGKMTFYTIE